MEANLEFGMPELKVVQNWTGLCIYSFMLKGGLQGLCGFFRPLPGLYLWGWSLPHVSLQASGLTLHAGLPTFAPSGATSHFSWYKKLITNLLDLAHKLEINDSVAPEGAKVGSPACSIRPEACSVTWGTLHPQRESPSSGRKNLTTPFSTFFRHTEVELVYTHLC